MKVKMVGSTEFAATLVTFMGWGRGAAHATLDGCEDDIATFGSGAEGWFLLRAGRGGRSVTINV